MPITYRRTFLCLCLLFLARIATAQDSTSSDSLFAMARKAAFDDRNRTKAIALSKQALIISPGYTDIAVFIGRVYTWEKQRDSARTYFQRALQQNAHSEDAYSGYTDMEYWNDDNQAALTVVTRGLSYHPQSMPLMLRKAKILNAMHSYKAAMLIVDTLLKTHKTNAEIRALANQVKDNVTVNKIGVSYDFVYFDKQFDDPWHLTSIQYSRQTSLGSIIARINHADRFKEKGLQYELEAYPRISKTFYTYLNLGHSDKASVFPKWRGGASLYANLPASFEAEIGMRYLYFSSSTFIYTAYIGKYLSNYLFGARTYLIPGKNTSRISHSYAAFGRYYFGGADDFIAANIGYGISPDDRPLNYQLSADRLISYKGGLEYRHAFKTFNIIGLSASILNQEYLPGKKGNQAQAGVVYQRRF